MLILFIYLPVNRYRIWKWPNSNIRIGISIKIHISGNRITKELNVIFFTIKNLKTNKQIVKNEVFKILKKDISKVSYSKTKNIKEFWEYFF